jgi:hypothetical protein
VNAILQILTPRALPVPLINQGMKLARSVQGHLDSPSPVIFSPSITFAKVLNVVFFLASGPDFKMTAWGRMGFFLHSIYFFLLRT